MMNTATNKIVKRDRRNSAKRLKAAIADAEKAKRKLLSRANDNAWTLAQLLECSQDNYRKIHWYKVTGNWYDGPTDSICEFLNVSVVELAKSELVSKYFNILWFRRFDGHTHETCKQRALLGLIVPIWSHLLGTDKCPCCGRSLNCEHKNNRSISQDDCFVRGIYHGGRCYHVSECLDCGEINVIDSSD